jgi:hypothetical protein
MMKGFFGFGRKKQLKQNEGKGWLVGWLVD